MKTFKKWLISAFDAYVEARQLRADYYAKKYRHI